MRKLLLAILLILPVQAWAQMYEPGLFRPITWSQVLNIDTNVRAVTRPIAQNGPISIICSAICWVGFGNSSNSNISAAVSTTTGYFMAGGILNYFYATSGTKIAIMANSGTGLAIVQELQR